MNIVLLVLLIFFVLHMIVGYSKGFLKIAFSLVSWIISVIFVSILAPIVSEFVIQNTFVDERIAEKMSGQLEEFVSSELELSLESQNEYLSIVLEKLNIQELGEKSLLESGIYDQIGQHFAEMIVRYSSIGILLILSLVAIGIVTSFLDIVNKIPIVKGANQIAGMLAGVVKAFIEVWIFFAFLQFLSMFGAVEELIGMIQADPVARVLYQNNLFVELIANFL